MPPTSATPSSAIAPSLATFPPAFVANGPLAAIAAQYGTPVYVYDAATIERQYKHLANAFAGLRCQLHYAAKANTNPHILRLLRAQGAGLDVVSIDEAHIGLHSGFQPSEILFTPNGVAFAEIEQAVALGIGINIDNISVLEQFGARYGGTVPVCLRLNPHISAGGHHKIQTGHIDSKFGISILQLRHLGKVVRSHGLHIHGLHVHTGSEFLDADVFLKGAELVFDAAMDFPDLKFLDFGSGFKVAYQAADHVTNVEELGQKLGEACTEFFSNYGRELEIWFEPGKYLVSEAGVLLATANTVKTTPASVFIGLDTGLNHLIRPMLYDAHHHIANVSRPGGTQRIYNVVGYICETDTFAYDRLIADVQEGDLLAICNAGAYGYSMASNYNSRPRPPEVLLHPDGTHQLIRRRETLDDLLGAVV